MSEKILPDSEVTLELLQEGDESVKVRPMYDFLRKGFKASQVFPKGERSITARREDVDIIIEYEDTADVSNFDREFLLINNNDLYYAGARIYCASRKIVDDFQDATDQLRIKVHPRSEDRLLDFATALKRYGNDFVWGEIVLRVNEAYVNAAKNRNSLIQLYRANVESLMMHNHGYNTDGPIADQEPCAVQFIYVLNGRIPSRVEFIVNFFLALKLNSAKFAQFFEEERELTLGETVSRTED